MANARADLEADLHRLQDMLRWTDGIVALGAAILLLLLVLLRPLG
jgi:hypothetical protein